MLSRNKKTKLEKQEAKQKKYDDKTQEFVENSQAEIPKMSKLSIIWNCIYLSLYLVFIGYNLLLNKGNKVINFILLGFTVLYGIFYFTTVIITNGNKVAKKKIKPAKRVYKLIRKIFKLINVLIMITLLLQTKGYYENNKFAVIMAFITTPMVIIQLSVEISKVIIRIQVKRLRNYYDKKLNNLYNEFKQADAVEKKNIISRIATELGKEKEYTEETTKPNKLKRLLALFGEKFEPNKDNEIVYDSAEEIIIENAEIENVDEQSDK